MISIIVPALNEEKNIQNTVELIAKVMSNSKFLPFEILVVDDGSNDQTAKLAKNSGAKVISHPHNIGYGRSLKDGIAAAKYSAIIIIDADGTYPITDIPKLYTEYKKGFDMVIGARSGKYYRESIFKMPMRWLLKFLVEWCTDRKIPDINSGLRIFNRSLAIKHFPHLCDTFSFTTSLTLAFMMTGKFVSYKPINYYKRNGASHVRLLRDSIRTLQYIVEAVVFYNPLKFFGLLSLIFIGLSFLILIFALTLKIVTLALLGIGIALISIVIFCLGLIAVQLKQIINK
jgi:glycosyltransferase involved in cell wall biosynthesis